MKRLPNPANEKSLYHYMSDFQGKIADGETDIPEGMRDITRVKLLSGMVNIYVGELKRWQLAQNKEANNLKTDLKIIEIKDYDNLSLNEHKDIKESDDKQAEKVA